MVSFVVHDLKMMEDDDMVLKKERNLIPEEKCMNNNNRARGMYNVLTFFGPFHRLEFLKH